MFLYRNILGQAWKITWRYRYLWFFGLFAALLGNGGEMEIVLNGFDSGSSTIIPGLQGLHNLMQINFFSVHTLDNIGRLLINDPATLLVSLTVFLLIVFLTVFIVWLVMISQAALVYNSAKIISGKKQSFKNGLETGMKKFWPVFGLNATVKIIIYILLLIVSLPVLAATYRAASAISLSFVVLFLIFIPLSVILSFVVKYAVAYVMIKNNNFVDAIKSSWKLFIDNWLISIEMAFLLFFINLLVGLCVMFLLFVLAIPFLFVALVFIKSGLFFSFWAVVTLALILFLFLIMFVGACLAVFQISSWTGLFVELTGRGGASKLTRIFRRS